MPPWCPPRCSRSWPPTSAWPRWVGVARGDALPHSRMWDVRCRRSVIMGGVRCRCLWCPASRLQMPWACAWQGPACSLPHSGLAIRPLFAEPGPCCRAAGGRPWVLRGAHHIPQVSMMGVAQQYHSVEDQGGVRDDAVVMWRTGDNAPVTSHDCEPMWGLKFASQPPRRSAGLSAPAGQRRAWDPAANHHFPGVRTVALAVMARRGSTGQHRVTLRSR